MALTNAQRQARYRERLKARAALAGSAVDAVKHLKEKLITVKQERDVLRAALQETSAEWKQHEMHVARLERRVADLEQANMRLRHEAARARARYVTGARART